MFVLYNKDKRQSQDNRDKEVQMKYRERTKKTRRWLDVLWGVNKDEKAKCRTMKTKNQRMMKCRVKEN